MTGSRLHDHNRQNPGRNASGNFTWPISAATVAQASCWFTVKGRFRQKIVCSRHDKQRHCFSFSSFLCLVLSTTCSPWDEQWASSTAEVGQYGRRNHRNRIRSLFLCLRQIGFSNGDAVFTHKCESAIPEPHQVSRGQEDDQAYVLVRTASCIFLA